LEAHLLRGPPGVQERTHREFPESLLQVLQPKPLPSVSTHAWLPPGLQSTRYHRDAAQLLFDVLAPGDLGQSFTSLLPTAVISNWAKTFRLAKDFGGYRVHSSRYFGIIAR